ncbi:hypothetical protein G9A89_001372 [Geosiphon pyriformis]|nr:hypothetical protein G9A89_001372 [Geosiphon pyriformis]
MAIYAREARCIAVENKKSMKEFADFHQIVVYTAGVDSTVKGFRWDRPNTLIPYLKLNIGKVNDFWLNVYLKHEERLISSVENKINNLRGKFQVIFTGHDVGGVYAMFAALAFKRKYPSAMTNVVTFGSPRPGDQVFARNINSIFPDLYRVVNMKAWTPQRPIPEYDYRHPHTEYLITDENYECDCLNSFGSKLYKCLPVTHHIKRFSNDEIDIIDENPVF